MKVKVSELPQASSLDGFFAFGVDVDTNRSVKVPMALLQGNEGKPVEFQVTATHVQWRVQGSTIWKNLMPLSAITGPKGDEVEFRKTATHLQWRVGDGGWQNLVSLLEIKGDPGVVFEQVNDKEYELD